MCVRPHHQDMNPPPAGVVKHKTFLGRLVVRNILLIPPIKHSTHTHLGGTRARMRASLETTTVVTVVVGDISLNGGFTE